MNDLRDLFDTMLVNEPAAPAMIDQVIDDGRRKRTRRRYAAASCATAVVVTAGTFISVAVSGGNASGPTNPELLDLATTASGNSIGTLVPGKYLHLVTHLHYGGRSKGDTWVSADGDVWRRDDFDGTMQYHLFPPQPGDHDSPAYFASLPTDPNTLAAYLNSHVTGSSTHDQAMFEAVGDMMRTGYVPPRLRVALVQVLQTVGHVTISTAETRSGREAIEATFTDPTGQSGPDSLFFDPSTASLIEEQDGVDKQAGVGGYIADYTDLGLVDEVPPDVLAHTGSAPVTTPDPNQSNLPSATPTTTS